MTGAFGYDCSNWRKREANAAPERVGQADVADQRPNIHKELRTTPRDFDFHRRYKRNPARCHRITVSGLMIAKALSTFGAKPYSPANISRSMLPKLGRLGDFRCRTLS
jgi:hypothetical protein